MLKKLDLNDINWQRLILNSIEQGLDLSEPLDDGGKPLLQICIDNENKDGRWQLKDLMRLLL